MLGAEIDFIIKGLDARARSIAASRKDAMYKKRQIFYLDKDASGKPKVYEDRIVQARVVAVTEKVVRVELFGVETSIPARDLSFDWLGDAKERFHVGEQILVRVLSVDAGYGSYYRPCRCEKRGREHQPRQYAALQGTGKIRRHRGRYS